MPPQGMLLIAAYLPKHWEVRFVNENVRPARKSEYKWADFVLVSGMHIQRDEINAINRAAHAAGKVTALGGPSVSGFPDYYPASTTSTSANSATRPTNSSPASLVRSSGRQAKSSSPPPSAFP